MSSVPFRVKAVYDYTSPHDDDLSFPSGQIITVIEEEDADWYHGEYQSTNGAKHEGIFPRNFVERYEPETPPRPVRFGRAEKEGRQAPQALQDTAHVAPSEPAFNSGQIAEQVDKSAPISSPVSSTAKAPVLIKGVDKPTSSSVSINAAAAADDLVSREMLQGNPSGALPKQSQPPTAKQAPPIAEKPATGSFRDRIAAFNKPAAAPVAPFKGLGSSGGSGFIKKPFVAPPPSKDAYIPPSREAAPQKVYRREEDPEVVAQISEDVGAAGKVAPVTSSQDPGNDEDQPKPTSLKDRIALLQKQQLEQASRHAEANQKKDKPKRPPKMRAESREILDAAEDNEAGELERTESADTAGERSAGSNYHEGPVPARSSLMHKPSKESMSQMKFSDFGPRDVVSDANDADQSAAGETTEDAEENSTSRDDSDDQPRVRAPDPPLRAVAARAQEQKFENEDSPEEEDEEAEEIDPEIKRKMEIRERMAKMSGGMGMHGMFGPPGGVSPAPSGIPYKQKPPTSADLQTPSGDDLNEHLSPSSGMQGPSIPVLPLLGTGRVQSPEPNRSHVMVEKDDHQESYPIMDIRDPEEVPDVEDVKPDRSSMPTRSTRKGPLPTSPQDRSTLVLPPSSDRAAPPPVPNDRPVPPPPPRESLVVEPSSVVTSQSPSAGSESDDELSVHADKLPSKITNSKVASSGLQIAPPTIPFGNAPAVPARPEGPLSPQSPSASRVSYLGSDPTSPSSPTTPSATKRNSRVPPIPGSTPLMTPPSQARPPPPPPPTAVPLSRKSTGDGKILVAASKRQAQDGSEEEEMQYDGDYDTDIASGATHKDALKSHAQDSSNEIVNATPVRSPTIAASSVLSPATASASHRAVPPPPPNQPPKSNRQSMDMPRTAPPPVPPPHERIYGNRDESNGEMPDEPNDLYSEPLPIRLAQQRPPPPPPSMQASLPQDRVAPVAPYPQLAQYQSMLSKSPSQGRPPQRQSSDLQRNSQVSRRSLDQPRPSGEQGCIATDVDLGAESQWWIRPNSPPPIFHNRRDLIFECEETSSLKRGGKTNVSKDVYVLFLDYSQTIVTARFDAKDPTDVAFEQRHEPPPPRLRQDQLEEAHHRFGQRIAENVTGKQNTTVADGDSHSLVLELLRPLSDALFPVGARAYGALVYVNLANASTQQYDEIRAGDIVTLRNAKFQGHRGPMHQKYSMEVGKPDHVGIVVDWDGTKKKVRAWEQGRESKKVKLESYKLGDLRSGEVKVWRVMPRSWVGWEGQN
ncbi:MAG: hypothetical protein M1827_003889 [Pycnora praestabilis]|nr:MAG: hypothetical protein M1827_003889 [Pycnora praestabilis]